MNTPTDAQILDALRKVIDPDLGRDIVSLGFVKDLRIDSGKVSFKVELTTPACPMKDRLRAECEERVRAVPGVSEVAVQMTAAVRGRPSDAPERILPGVKNIVAVASGKGGVGKSTVAVNLSLALRATGCSVGLLDADVYGPSMAMMLGIRGQPEMSPDRKFFPVESAGLKVLSMAFFDEGDRPVIWRGPMVHGFLQGFLKDVEWGDLDYLVIDLPPGTGDAQLSISQLVPLSGAVIVTTPQDVSLIDARKGLRMFEQLRVPVLGIVENMSYFVCTDCGKRHEIFRHGGGKKTASDLGVPFLGEVPIDPEVVLGGDEGAPIVVRKPDSPAAKAYVELAGRVAARLSTLSRGGPAPVMPGPMEWK